MLTEKFRTSGFYVTKIIIEVALSMEASTTIRKMMAGNKIIVPSYQRAYSWETPNDNTDKNTHTNVFLTDLEDYYKSDTTIPYYFGHFLFEEKGQSFCVIDGQQRLTTIVIFLSSLFFNLQKFGSLSEDEEICYEDMVKRRGTIRFSTVNYDNQLFIDYVIEQTRVNKNGLDTESSRRIVRAFDFFNQQLAGKSKEYLTRILSIISESTCTTHLVQNESEAIQMFIFQNNRGKKPSNLEIVKAQFMYNIYLYGNEDKYDLIEEIKNRFEKIYRSIASIEYRINEDDILLYTLKVHFNSLWETNAVDKIDKEISEENSINFIKEFTRLLSSSFEHLSSFFGKDERENFSIHSLITLGSRAIYLPFIIKAYKFGLKSDDIEKLCASFEHLVLRHRLIGTRADITSRINGVFERFTESSKEIQPIIERIEGMKTASDLWLSYWNNEWLEKSIQGEINHATAKYILWKYEVHLENQGYEGYAPTRFNSIENPHLEHVAPKTEPSERPHGYSEYDEEFRNQYLNCLGNYLLLSRSHNCAIGNVPFLKKRKTYTHNEQQREIQNLVHENGVWGKEIIQNRKEKIIRFILKEF